MSNTQEDRQKSPLKNGNPQHKFTKEDHAKGGKTVTLEKRLVKRKYCNNKCPIYPCMWQPNSKKYEVNKLVRNKKVIKYKCALNEQPPILQKKFFKLVNGKEDDFMNIMNEALTKISSPGDLIKWGEKIHKMRFGDKNKTDINITGINIKWEDDDKGSKDKIQATPEPDIIP